MRVEKRGAEGVTWTFILLAIGIIVLVLVFPLLKNSISKGATTLGANDPDVIVAAKGCGLAGDDKVKTYCYELHTIEKKAFLVKDQRVTCSYLDQVVKAQLADADEYVGIICPSSTWLTRCRAELSGQDKDYEILINGQECSKKEYALEFDKLVGLGVLEWQDVAIGDVIGENTVRFIETEKVNNENILKVTLIGKGDVQLPVESYKLTDKVEKNVASITVDSFTVECKKIRVDAIVPEKDIACAAGKDLGLSNVIGSNRYYCCSP
jgi:hypothetical protein